MNVNLNTEEVNDMTDTISKSLERIANSLENIVKGDMKSISVNDGTYDLQWDMKEMLEKIWIELKEMNRI
jgi:hypothetical protein